MSLKKETKPNQVSLLHSLEQAAESIGLYENADKTEYTGFNQEGDTSTLNGGTLKLVDKLTYLVAASLIPSKKDELDTRDTAGEARTKS